MSELRRLKQLEEENRKLRKLVVDLRLDKHLIYVIVSLASIRHTVPEKMHK